jgi:hypothetical protein
MHERREAQPGPLPFHQIRHGSERQSVDQHPGTGRYRGKDRRGVVERRRRWVGKAGIQRLHVHGPAVPAEPLDHPPVVDVATGRRLELSRDEEDQRTHRLIL